MTKDALGWNEKGDQLMTRLFQGITTRAYRAVVWLECKFMYRVPVFGRVADRMEADYLACGKNRSGYRCAVNCSAIPGTSAFLLSSLQSLTSSRAAPARFRDSSSRPPAAPLSTDPSPSRKESARPTWFPGRATPAGYAGSCSIQ